MKKRFYFHYNKPLSKQFGKPTLTIHWGGLCHYVNAIKCYVPVESKNNKTQPHVVMQGYAENVNIKEGVARIS